MGIKKKKKNFEGCANSSHGCSLTINRLNVSKIDLCVSFFLSLSFSICRITANWSSLMGPRVFISLISRHDWTIYHIVKLDRFIILLFVWRVNFPTCSNPWSSSEFFGIILSESLIENDSSLSPFCPFRVNVLYSNGVRGEYYLSSFTSIFTSPRHSMISR